MKINEEMFSIVFFLLTLSYLECSFHSQTIVEVPQGAYLRTRKDLNENRSRYKIKKKTAFCVSEMKMFFQIKQRKQLKQ